MDVLLCVCKVCAPIVGQGVLWVTFMNRSETSGRNHINTVLLTGIFNKRLLALR